MAWLTNFLFKSSIGQKIVMSISGLFLILFLVVHLLGNLQLLKDDHGMSFNFYTYFMTHNPLIKLISYVLYLTILLHTIQGLKIYFSNRGAKGGSYVSSSTVSGSLAERYMAHFGSIIFIFIIIHLWQYWLKMKMNVLPMISIEGHDHPFADLYTPVQTSFQNAGNVIFYIFCDCIIAFHLWHGFQSAFQTLGINHKKYTPLIKVLGMIYSILIPLGFAMIPLYVFLTHNA